MENKYEDNKMDVSVALKEIQAMLRIENEYWSKSNNNTQTEKNITQYDVGLDLLIDFVHEKNFIGFLLTFQEYHLTISGIRSCFRSSGPQVANIRKRGERLFRNVCIKMLSMLKKDNIRELAKNTQLNMVEVEKFFQAQLAETNEALKKDEDIYEGLFN